METKYLGILLIIVLVVFSARPIVNHIKILLLLSEEFPQITIKPLGLLTSPPLQEEVWLESEKGKIKADLFIPSKSGEPKPALILAMGIKTAPQDKPIILGFAETMSRLGYVVMWPRLEILDQGVSVNEEPETFVQAFHYLERLDSVEKDRISFIGFSAGSSVAFVSAAHAQISQKVHGLVFFGGYYDIVDYLLSLATGTAALDKEIISWKGAEDAKNHAAGLLRNRQAHGVLKIFEAKDREEVEKILKEAPQGELRELKKFSPDEVVDKVKARIFILHDKSDSYVPYFESVKLNRALPKSVERTYLLVNLFEHVQPKKGFSQEILGEFMKLYGFLYEAISYL